jgi:hypothetical protein
LQETNSIAYCIAGRFHNIAAPSNKGAVEDNFASVTLMAWKNCKCFEMMKTDLEME